VASRLAMRNVDGAALLGLPAALYPIGVEEPIAAMRSLTLALMLVLLSSAMLRYRRPKQSNCSNHTSSDDCKPRCTTSIVCDDSKTGLIYLRWPSDAQYSEFAIEYDQVARKLSQAKDKFGLVHDLRGSDLSPMYGALYDKVQADANAIARLGRVASAAIVLDVGPILRATITILTHTLSPVPTRVFSDSEAACAWVTERSVHTQKAVEDTGATGPYSLDRGCISESESPASRGRRASSACTSFSAAISRCLPRHSCF